MQQLELLDKEKFANDIALDETYAKIVTYTVAKFRLIQNSAKSFGYGIK